MSQLYPLQLFYLLHTDNNLPSHQVLFSVPKKKIKKAAQRNSIRRRMKEAYRLHKHELPTVQPHSPRFLLGYVYVGPPKPISYALLCSKVVVSLRRLVATYEQHECKQQDKADEMIISI
jgi:ribonuclease P protein component